MIKKLLADRTFIIFLVVILILFIIGLIIFLRSKPSGPVVSPVTDKIEFGLMSKLITWEDPAGFKFNYPENITIDPHQEDEENYAHLQLAVPGQVGNIVIWVKETGYKDIEDWLRKEVSGGQIFDTQLAGHSAKKIAYSKPTKLVIAAIDVDALVLVEMMPDSQGYWQKVYDNILSSFEFVPLAGEPTTAPVQTGGAPADTLPAGGQVLEEPEEVIE